MSNPTINDEESKKFLLSSWWDIYQNVEVVTLDPLTEPTWTTNDLELKKFNWSNAVRIVLTV